jgi:hypothetical protein
MVLAIATGCAAPPVHGPGPAPVAIALANAGFELEPQAGRNCVPGWECSAHSDSASYRFSVSEATAHSGRRSLLVERVSDQPWAMATQSVRDASLGGARLRFSIAVRTEGVSGGAGPVFVAYDGAGGVLAHGQRLMGGDRDWGRVELEFEVPKGAVIFEVGASFEGPGRAWLDDARLEILEPSMKPKNPV